MILALETATSICSVAFEDAAGGQFEKRTDARNAHSEELFLFLKELMKEHQFSVDDLSAVLVSEGPGSYTGLRIAASGVKGLLFGSEVPLYSVSTLASFAIAAREHVSEASRIHAVIDARRKHLYHQGFDVSGREIEAVSEVGVTPIKSLEKMIHPGDIIIGSGIKRLDEKLVERVRYLGKDFISARSMIQLYHQKQSEQFIQKVTPGAFNPKYYTSKQV
jgi:tRNA threonylcarbamoyl adenosine modification protein YeaZ